MIHRTVVLAHDTQGLPRVVVVLARPGAVRPIGEGRTAPLAAEWRELEAPVPHQAQGERTRAPVPDTGQGEQFVVHLGQRSPGLRNPWLGLDDDAQELRGHRRSGQPGGDIGEGDRRHALLRAHPEAGDESGQRARVPEEHAPLTADELEPQTVTAPARLDRHGGRPHLPHGGGRQDPVVTLGQEGGEPQQVLRGGPELAGGRHDPEVLGGLAQHDVRPGVDGPAARVRCHGAARRTVHGQRFQDLAAQRLIPGDAANRLHQRTEQGVTGVGVVMPMPGRMHLRPVAQHIGDLRPQAAGRPLPPGGRRLGSQPRTVAEQLMDGHPAHAGAGKVLLQGVVQVDQPLVPQPQHQNGRERLGDRADPVLRIGVGSMPVDTRTRPAPHLLSLPPHRSHEGRRTPVPLGDGDAVQQSAPGTGKQVFAERSHGPTLIRPAAP
ncbi:hypothetical protein SBADM41S_11532 [Streptomyces badius]